VERVAKEILDRAAGREVVLYGCGECAQIFMDMLLAYNVDTSFFVDRKHVHYKKICGRPVYPSSVLNPQEHYVALFHHSFLIIESMCKELKWNKFTSNDCFDWRAEADRDIDWLGVKIGRRSAITRLAVPSSGRNCLKSIGRFCSINANVEVGYDHSLDKLTTCSRMHDILSCSSEQPNCLITIGHDVWIGANVFINASKVNNIGNGAIIGTGAVVLKDVPPYAVVAGVPAKVKKYRFSPEQIAIMERVQWWNWDDESMRTNADCFSDPSLFFRKFR